MHQFYRNGLPFKVAEANGVTCEVFRDVASFYSGPPSVDTWMGNLMVARETGRFVRWAEGPHVSEETLTALENAFAA